MSQQRLLCKVLSILVIPVMFSAVSAYGNVTLDGGKVNTWDYGISIGQSAETNGEYGISFGHGTLAEGNYSTAIGYQSKAGQRIDSNRTPRYSTAIGYKAIAGDGNSVAIGSEVSATQGGVSIGTLATAAQNGIAIGFGSSGSKTQAEYYGIAIGAGAQTTKNYATAIGNSAKSNALYALALGDSSTAFGENSVALGNDSATQESESYTVSVGNSEYGIRRRITNLERGINDTDAVNVSQLKQLGQNVSDVIGGNFSFSEGTWDGVTIDGTSYSNISEALEALSGSGSGTSGSLTEGSNIHFEQESDGTQSVHLNDDIKLNSVELAVAPEITQNGNKNLAATTGHVHSLGSSVAGLFGGDFAVQTDGSISGGVFSVNGETFTTINDALNYLAGGWTFEPVDNSAQAGAEGGTGSAAETTPPQSSTILPGETLTVNAGNDIDITQNADKEYTISVAPDLRKEIEEGYAAADETLKADITEAYKQADSELKAGITDAYTKADENLEADITKAYTEADATLETKITEAYKAVDAELQAGIDKNAGTIKTIGDVLGGEANGYKAPSFNTVTTNSLKMGDYTVSATDGGLDMGRAKLTNIARGDVSAGSTDAVTGGQLWDAYQRFDTMGNNIYREMDDLREDVNVVGAHAAALSGLHPIQYNPYEPTTLSAAVGAYRDEYAVAVGVFHYTRENVMFNLGASLCSDGDVMGRAGVSFAVGKSSDKKPRLASTMGGLQKQVLDMQAKLDGLEEKNARNEEIIKQNAEIMAQNEKLIRELTKKLEAER